MSANKQKKLNTMEVDPNDEDSSSSEDDDDEPHPDAYRGNEVSKAPKKPIAKMFKKLCNSKLGGTYTKCVFALFTLN